MIRSIVARRAGMFALAVSAFTWVGSVRANDPAFSSLDAKAITVSLPKEIPWKENKSGSALAVLVGDPAKPGLYITLTKWHAGHMSRPHFHANDRYITVIKGTWWVGTGKKYDPASTRAVPEGSFVTHTGKEIHYDGAKDGDVILQILGMGPATSIDAEEK